MIEHLEKRVRELLDQLDKCVTERDTEGAVSTSSLIGAYLAVIDFEKALSE